MSTQKELALRRLKIIKGQIENLDRMIRDNVYCVDTMTQCLAVQKALSSLNRLLLEDHLSHCVVKQIKDGEIAKTVDELSHLYHLRSKT